MKTLSDAASAVIAGLVDDTDDFDRDDIRADDAVWEEIRAAFPRWLIDAAWADCGKEDGGIEIPAAYKL